MATRIEKISKAEENKFKKAIAPYEYTVKTGATKTRTTIVVKAPSTERSSVKTQIESKLKSAKFPYTKSTVGGSTGSTDVAFKDHIVKITYKPLSGGMSETTLNSTITELVPAIIFMNNKRAAFTDVKKLYDKVVELIPSSSRLGVYVNDRDQKAGIDFIKTMPSSSKFNEKMKNAIAIIKYLKDVHKKSPIKQVYWGYRAKPTGIAASHKGDLFVEFKTGEMLGVSLKAGGEKTAEPQLNTYVNKFFDDFGRDREKEKLKKKVYNEIHSVLGLDEDWESRSKKIKSIKTITAYKNKYNKKYEALYDDMLEIIRNELIKQVNKDKADTIDYIKKQVIQKDEDVPLVVVKASDTNYQMITDEDAIETFIPKIVSIKAYKSASSKQAWHIDLNSKNDTLTMNMSVRTNKTEPNNKIAQGFNLAIKFNGLTH